MAGLDIGISGLDAARQALEVVGNNIANASTEGYHRQDVVFNTKDDIYINGLFIGQGVDFGSILRRYDTVLEKTIGVQESAIKQYGKELETLSMMETAFGDLATDESGLISVMSKFYNALRDLSVEPTNTNLQYGVINAAKSMVYRFQSLGTELSDMESGLHSEALSVVDDINSLAQQVAQLNQKIYDAEVQGDEASNVVDQRDLLITRIKRLVGATTQEGDFGVVNVMVSDMPIVMGTQYSELELQLLQNGDNYDFALAPKDSIFPRTDISGGELGGLFSLRNDILKTVADDLDTLALTVISEMNNLHVQGVGSEGSFTTLTGKTMTSTNVSDFVPPVTDGGVIQVRVTHADSSVTTHNITVNSTDTLTTIAADFDAISGLDAAVTANKLQITATDAGDPNCTFDFIPVTPSTNSDTSGFLAAAGLNTFFSGTTAATMGITDYVSNLIDGIGHIAVSRTESMVDNENVLAMGKLGDTAVSGLGGLTPKEYYIQITTSIGSQIEGTKLKEENSQIVWNNLSQQRNESSGVDMNTEATKMLTYERMFQAMAKYISVISQTMDTVMEITI